jgi:tetratricopeptide (TPR) repeat protein
MLGFAWLTLRQAQEALKNGRLEDAHRLLGQPAAQGHRRSWELARQVAQAFVQRGQRQLFQDNPEAAWNDLMLAEQLGGAEESAIPLRQALAQRGLAEIRSLLQQGEPGRALEAIHRLRERSVQAAELPALEDAARAWQQAREQASRGEFRPALELVERVRRLFPGAAAPLDSFERDLMQRQRSFAELVLRLHEAADQARWRDAIELAEQVLAAAPNHAEARKVKALAWKAIEPVTVPLRAVPKKGERPPEPEGPPQRFLLWIDGVGGYLVCLGNRVTLGQATGDATVDVPLFADVSRHHATLTRDAEGYLLEAIRPLSVNNKPAERALLRPGDRITLANACQLRFVQPSPVSTSARLDLISKHRLPLAVDAVLLMADSLLLGPGAQVHVTMPDLKKPLVIYRHKDRLGVRYPGSLTIDGQRCTERGLLGPSSTVAADEFVFAIEPVGTRMGRS